MRTKWLLAMATATVSVEAALLVACANDGETGTTYPEEESHRPLPAPSEDAAPTEEKDASPCTKDCEYFVDECTDDVLCNAGPFASTFEGGPLDPRTHIRALSGRSANDVWLAGTVGTVAKFDGTAWKRSATETQQSFHALWLRPDAEIAFDDPSRLYVRGIGNPPSTSAGGWWLDGTAAVDPDWMWSGMRLVSAWAHPDGQTLWIGGATTGGMFQTGLWRMRYADGAFRVDPVASGQCYALPCLYITTYDGLTPNEVWAVGPQGAALRIQNAEEETPTITGYNTQTTYALNDVWVRASDDVWAVGSTGTIRRYRGDARFWEVYSELGTTQHLNAIVGSSASDIWIAGDEATVFHFDGTEWKRLKVAGLGRRRPKLERMWMSSTGQVWIAGQGALLSLGGKP